MTRAAEFLALDKDIRLARRAALQKIEVERTLREAAANAEGLARSVAHLDGEAVREEADVDALDGVGGWMSRLTGSWQDRVDREAREAIEARRKADHARRQLEAVRAQLAEAKALAVRLAEAEHELATAIARKYDRLLQHAHPDAERLGALHDARLGADEAAEAYECVLRAGHAALAALGLVERDVSDLAFRHALDEANVDDIGEWGTVARGRALNAPLAELRGRFAELGGIAEAAGLHWSPSQVDERVGPRGLGDMLADSVESTLGPVFAALSADFKRALTKPEANRAQRVGTQLADARVELTSWCDGLMERLGEKRAERERAELAWREAVIAAGFS